MDVIYGILSGIARTDLQVLCVLEGSSWETVKKFEEFTLFFFMQFMVNFFIFYHEEHDEREGFTSFDLTALAMAEKPGAAGF